MAWTLGGKTIHVDDEGDERSIASLYAVQQVLDATSETISYYGAQSARRNLTFILDEDLNGNGGRLALEAAAIANSDVNLTSDEGSQGNYRILELSFARKMAINHTNPVWLGRAVLLKV